ncbi:chemosensory receptor c [Plakobranchus ocellatus]|uniref:Chemosensory receptor c n=1 Tax=Plakobranchus ocellatus TaxID=259542 RepID=A0AAV4C491_9GAST|nr:chemosensory receptor c [Plakobranchus ocellatus]
MDDTPLVSDAVALTLVKVFQIPSNVLFTILGIVGNVVNIVVFSKLNPKDTMTISLCALAVSDLLYAIFSFPFLIVNFYNLGGIYSLHNVNLSSLMWVFASYQKPLFQKISATITAFVSCERSVCVVKPFLVKQLFTKRRVLIALVGIFVFWIALFMPVFATAKLVWKYPFNKTSPVLVFQTTPKRAAAESFVQLFLGFPIEVTNQVIIVISSVFMAAGLKRHQKFRQSASSRTEDDLTADGKTDGQRKRLKDTSAQTTSFTAAVTAAEAAVAKEQRLIRTVLALAVIHILVHCPILAFKIAVYIIPDLRASRGSRRYTNLYRICIGALNWMLSLNGVINFFVYVKVNTKFRTVFGKMFFQQESSK